MKTSELKGPALDWAVATCEKNPHEVFVIKGCSTLNAYVGGSNSDSDTFVREYSPSTQWSHGGPIIEREKICPDFLINGQCLAVSRITEKQGYGATPLIAAMRCYVASKLGDEVDVPEELL